MRLLVTGATGYIGGHLVPRLRSEGHEVVAVGFTSPRAEMRVDIRDMEAVRALLTSTRQDCVIHLAALASVPACQADPQTCFETNIMGTMAVALAARDLGLRMIFTSSAAVYGEVTEQTPVSAPTRPLNLYGVSKVAGEDTIRALVPQHVILRLFNVYGGKCKRSYVVPDAVRRIRASGDSIPCRFSGTGEESRDFVHMDDVVSAIHQAIYSPSFGTFNVGSGRTTRIREVVEKIARAMGKPGFHPIFEGHRAGDCLVNWADLSGSNSLPGWSPRQNLEQELAVLAREGPNE